MSDSELKTNAENAENSEDENPEEGSEVVAGAETPEDAGEAAYEPPDRETYLELKRRADECDGYRDEALRAKADLDNFQKRTRRERPKLEDQAVRRLVLDLLPIVDNFERAIDSHQTDGATVEGVVEGVRMIHQMLKQFLTDHGVEEIQAVGLEFDPDLHEAIAQEAVTDRDTGEVLEEQQKGYVHKGVLVRPSRVKVAKRVEEERQDGVEEDEAGETNNSR